VSLDSRARLLVFRVGEVLWDEGVRDPEAEVDAVASEGMLAKIVMKAYKATV